MNFRRTSRTAPRNARWEISADGCGALVACVAPAHDLDHVGPVAEVVGSNLRTATLAWSSTGAAITRTTAIGSGPGLRVDAVSVAVPVPIGAAGVVHGGRWAGDLAVAELRSPDRRRR